MDNLSLTGSYTRVFTVSLGTHKQSKTKSQAHSPSP